MSNLRRPKSLIVTGTVAICLAATGVAAYAATNGGGESTPSASLIQQFIKVAPGPGRQLRENGLSASDAKPAFTLANGAVGSTVSDGSTTCLVLTIRGHDGATCASPAGIVEGHGISVADECGAGGRNLMEIAGLAPDKTQSVRLRSSDGTSQSTLVVNGAFKFDGTNPAAGEPYPTNVEWIGDGGATTGSAGLPVKGDQFCG
jgi:hypothetical protein